MKNSGCFWYRNKTPLDALKRKTNWEIDLVNMGDPVDFNFDIAQLSRSYEPGYEDFVFALKKKGIKIWYDIDDAVDLVEPWNPFSYANLNSLGSYYFMLHQADFITTTTPKLKEHLETLTNTPIELFENYLVPKEWQERPKTHKGIRIGFAGSSSHMKDLNVVMPALEALAKKRDFTFVVYGLDTDCNGSLETWKERQVKNCAGKYDVLPYGIECEKFYQSMKNIKHELVDCVRWELHPRTLAALDLDIGICPLLETEFNEKKTPIKFYEYAMTGTPALCSNVSPFKDETSVVCDNDFLSWYDHLESLVMFHDVREATLKEQKEYVLKNRLVDEHIDTLEAIVTKYA